LKKEFLEFVKSIFTLRGKGEQIEQQKKRAGSLLLGPGGGSPISGGRMEQHQHQLYSSRPPTVRSVVSD
jgi:hypothetical protein